MKKVVRRWPEYQDGQSILLTTPSVLVGYRVEVYRAEGTTQWYTAVIQSYNENTRVSTCCSDIIYLYMFMEKSEIDCHCVRFKMHLINVLPSSNNHGNFIMNTKRDPKEWHIPYISYIMVCQGGYSADYCQTWLGDANNSK